ncbi:MAG: GNAT family N-acetyltransferase [Flavonifractor plautii]
MRTATSRRWRTSPCPGCWNTTCWSRWIWRCWRSPTASCPAVAGCCWPAGGEEIVGMVMLELQGKGQCELLKFGVKEAYRGRGIGTALMEAALQAARDAGQKKAVLTSNHQLREALRLYERFGFKYVTYSDKWFQLSDIRMEREL